MKLDHTGKILELTGLNVRNTYIQDSQGAVVPPANAGDAGMIPGSGRSPGGGKGNPLQYSHLENPMDRGTTEESHEQSPWDHKRVRYNIATEQEHHPSIS